MSNVLQLKFENIEINNENRKTIVFKKDAKILYVLYVLLMKRYAIKKNVKSIEPVNGYYLKGNTRNYYTYNYT